MLVCIQIGNTDDKLSQAEWSNFCHRVLALCESAGTVHFSGGSSTDLPWQNYCVCVECEFCLELKGQIELTRKRFGQESVVWLEGNAEFV
jgi:hypothetical protein